MSSATVDFAAGPSPVDPTGEGACLADGTTLDVFLADTTGAPEGGSGGGGGGGAFFVLP